MITAATNWKRALEDDIPDLEIEAIAAQIERYLQDKKTAADTLQGILMWWLLRQRIDEQEDKVKQAVNKLLATGKLTKRVLGDGTELFTSAAQGKELKH